MILEAVGSGAGLMTKFVWAKCIQVAGIYGIRRRKSLTLLVLKYALLLARNSYETA